MIKKGGRSDGIFASAGIDPDSGAECVFLRHHLLRRRDRVYGGGVRTLLVREQTDGILCVSGRPVRHGWQPVAEDRVPHSAAVGARPRVYDCGVCPRGRDGLFVSVRAHAECRRHVRRDGTADRAEVGARRVHRADRAGAVFTDVSRRAYAAGRRRGVFDGGGAAGAVLSGVPVGTGDGEGDAVAAERGGAAGRGIYLLHGWAAGGRGVA